MKLGHPSFSLPLSLSLSVCVCLSLSVFGARLHVCCEAFINGVISIFRLRFFPNSTKKLSQVAGLRNIPTIQRSIFLLQIFKNSREGNNRCSACEFFYHSHRRSQGQRYHPLNGRKMNGSKSPLTPLKPSSRYLKKKFATFSSIVFRKKQTPISQVFVAA